MSIGSTEITSQRGMNVCNTVILKLWNFSERYQFKLWVFAHSFSTERYSLGVSYKLPNDSKAFSHLTDANRNWANLVLCTFGSD